MPHGYDFDIDKYLIPFLPAPRLDRLPYPIARFLGYRPPNKTLHDYTTTIIFWAFIGEFVAVSISINVLKKLDKEYAHIHIPTVLSSLGASGVLLFNAIESPLGQPREFLLSHILAAAIGIGITKLFTLSESFQDLDWLCAATASGVTSVVMTLSGTVHPPAGATCLTTTMDTTIRELGWLYIPLVILNILLLLTVALLFDNVQRRYPRYWWTAKPLRKATENDSLADANEMIEIVGTEEAHVPVWIQNRLDSSAEDRIILSYIKDLLREKERATRPAGSPPTTSSLVSLRERAGTL